MSEAQFVIPEIFQEKEAVQAMFASHEAGANILFSSLEKWLETYTEKYKELSDNVVLGRVDPVAAAHVRGEMEMLKQIIQELRGE